MNINKRTHRPIITTATKPFHHEGGYIMPLSKKLGVEFMGTFWPAWFTVV